MLAHQQCTPKTAPFGRAKSLNIKTASLPRDARRMHPLKDGNFPLNRRQRLVQEAQLAHGQAEVLGQLVTK
eukprot:3603607-Alexandrium_andersonii.AAC.1